MKKAFTMLELVMVIVVIGILAAVMLPRVASDRLAEAATQVISHIRYTQHLAMVDDQFDATPNSDWYEQRWQIIFGDSAYTDNTPAYTIFSDTSGTGEPDESEMAINPLDSSKLLTGGYSGEIYTTNDKATQKMNLGSYGINDYDLNGGCSGARISFDHLGRPLRGDLSSMSGPYTAGTQRLIITQCEIELCTTSDCATAGNSEKIIIAIEPETGYAHILP